MQSIGSNFRLMTGEQLILEASGRSPTLFTPALIRLTNKRIVISQKMSQETFLTLVIISLLFCVILVLIIDFALHPDRITCSFSRNEIASIEKCGINSLILKTRQGETYKIYLCSSFKRNRILQWFQYGA